MKKTDHEERIKEYLEERRIQPTPNLWENLATELDNKEKRRPYKKSYRWVGIVAILIGIFGGSLLFLPTPQNRISKVSKKGDVVDSVFYLQKPKSVPEVSQEVQFSVLLQSQEEERAKEHRILRKQESARAVLIPPSGKKSSSPLHSLDQKEVAQTDESLPKVENLSPEKEKETPEQGTTTYTKRDDQEEAEELLREALYQEFLMAMKKERDSVRILARAEQLLKEINIDLEKEEDRAFRDRVWEVVQKGWDKARAIVAINPDIPN